MSRHTCICVSHKQPQLCSCLHNTRFFFLLYQIIFQKFTWLKTDLSASMLQSVTFQWSLDWRHFFQDLRHLLLSHATIKLVWHTIETKSWSILPKGNWCFAELNRCPNENVKKVLTMAPAAVEDLNHLYFSVHCSMFHSNSAANHIYLWSKAWTQWAKKLHVTQLVLLF